MLSLGSVRIELIVGLPAGVQELLAGVGTTFTSSPLPHIGFRSSHC